MKIALLADIHANLAALHAVIEDLDAWGPDMVVVAGDTVNRGPHSRECLELTLHMRDQRGWRLIQGNHEGYVLRYDRERHRPDFPRSGPRHEVSRIIGWTHAQVEPLLSAIRELPEQLYIQLDGATLAVYHASVRHNRDGVLRRARRAELRQQIDPRATIFCVGHTHMPFVRRVDQTLVVNVGSVGLPFDGDWRAAYARITPGRAGWQAQIVRLPYDRAATERAFIQSGMIDAVGSQSAIMLRELQTGNSLMFDFVPAYQERILAGQISVDDAVREFLGQHAQTV